MSPDDGAVYEIRVGRTVVATCEDEHSAIETARDAARSNRQTHDVWLVHTSPDNDADASDATEERVYRVQPNGVVTAT